MLTATVYGPAQAMGSKRAFVVGGRAVVVDNSSKKLRTYQEGLRESMRECKPEQVMLGPVSVTITIFMARPKCHYGTGRNAHVLKANAPRYPIVAPDYDKCARAVSDCGTGIWWRDDSQIVMAIIDKRYADEGEERTVVSAVEIAS